MLEDELVQEMTAWARVAEDPPASLERWARRRTERLHTLATTTLPGLAGTAVVHTDLRNDNVLIESDGTVRLVDWPWASRGASWFDAVTLLVDLETAGTDAEPFLPDVRALGATHEDVLGLLAGLAGFFVEAASRPAPPGLPTVRDAQRANGEATLGMLRRWL